MMQKLLLVLAAIGFAAPAIASDQTPPDYRTVRAWAARPGMTAGTRLVPVGATPAAKHPAVDVFYAHPTTFRSSAWNADLVEEARPDGPNMALLARQAGAFNGCCRIFAPWYRQASFRAFTDRASGGEKAYDLAYGDVLRAFDDYMAHDNHGRPFVLVGHSQGAYHLLRLLRERIDGKPAAQRMVAAYVIGIGVSEGDFGTTYPHLQSCHTPAQTGCVVSWASFLDGTDTVEYRTRNEGKFRTAHATGDPTIVCVNPLTFDTADPIAAAARNPGTLPAGANLAPPLVTHAVGARCERGVLMVSPPSPALGLLPIPGGGNMHYHDIALFYEAIRDNAAQRSAAFLAERRRSR